jgi:spermidine/putrescine transport system ATP-binding protein
MTDIDVELVNITKKFGELVAVDDVSFQVTRGSFFSILGPSGCGKTTTLKMISGFEEPENGDVFIGGERVNGVPPNHRRVNMVFQQLALFPLMTVSANVGFGLKMSGVPKAERQTRVEEMLEKVDLPGLGDRKPDQLSGGQQQRVAIARCLILDPTVLLLDEPLGALDLKLRDQMKIQLKHLQHEVGTTFIYITHDQSEALVMSDQVAVMNEGHLLQIGAPDELYSNPADYFVASFVGESNAFEGPLTHIEHDYAVFLTGPFEIKSPIHPKIRVGENCRLFIRPERIRLMSSDAGSDALYDNQFPGEIQDVVFDGAVARAFVDLGHNTVITVLVTRTSDTPLPVEGEAVLIGWNALDALCFPE